MQTEMSWDFSESMMLALFVSLFPVVLFLFSVAELKILRYNK